MNAIAQKRILVTDDVRAIAHSLAGILRPEGYEVEIAHDGEECLSLVKSFRPDLIILDLLMPKMHGIDVLKCLRADPAFAETGVIIHSTKDFTTELRIASELGASGMINKPSSRDELLGKVAEFFGERPRSDPKPVGVPLQTGAPEFLPILDNARGVLRFWGTRGSFPTSGPRFLRYGGHTTCMEFECEEGTLIFDAGSGIRDLGNRLASEDDPGHIHLFVTHTHWDHIQGIPSFAPLYQPGARITIYGDKGFGESLESLISGQLSTSYFPVHWDEIQAEVEFRYLTDDPVSVGGVEVSREYVNHPGAAVAYKIAYRGHTTVFMPDNEFLQGYLGAPDDQDVLADLLVPYGKIVDFVEGVDVLVFEAQFMNDEYANRIGWGHSGLSNACALASLAGVKRWVVTHHDTSHDDDFLDAKLALTRRLMRRLGAATEVVYAYDGFAEWL